jgi:hypothetical protein
VPEYVRAWVDARIELAEHDLVEIDNGTHWVKDSRVSPRDGCAEVCRGCVAEDARRECDETDVEEGCAGDELDFIGGTLVRDGERVDEQFSVHCVLVRGMDERWDVFQSIKMTAM